jgi:2-dehydro-3-deoxyphosphooctonate aldolase (KDO 8-P synthase)
MLHKSHTVKVGSLEMANNKPFILMAGPCVIESRDHVMKMAESLKKLCEKHNVPLIFKSSFDKANRLSISSYRGVNLEEGLGILKEVRDTFDVPVITDVHTEEQCAIAAPYVDMLQTPALLVRQTDFLKAAAETKKPLNIKKGQFLAPWDMKNVVKKMESFGNTQITLCERGVSVGYNALVSDFRGIEIMRQTLYPVVFDATHSVQQPGGAGTSTSGERRFVPLLIRASLSSGVGAIYAEVHNDPNKAPSDGPNMLPLEYLPHMLPYMVEIDRMTKEYLSNVPRMEDVYAA